MAKNAAMRATEEFSQPSIVIQLTKPYSALGAQTMKDPTVETPPLTKTINHRTLSNSPTADHPHK